MTLINAKRFDFVKGDEKSGTIIVNVLCIEFKLRLSECLLCNCPSLTFCVYNNKHLNLLISKCVDSTAIFSQSALLPRY